MAFKASLSVLLGCQFGAANKLLQAAEKGNSNEVSEILCSKPQLAAYTGFNNSFSPLHRAAAGGYVDVCRSIIEPIKQRVKVAEAAVASGRKKISLLKKWQGLLTTVLNQRTSRSMTALMLACENGHAAVAAYLLREGADPLACDWVHMRNCMHYAAMGGQVDCLRLLCSVNTQVQAKDGYRALKDVVVQDIQVETCRFIDQRAFGGLTALHFAVVTGNLEAVQALLRGGASIMVKTDGEAYIGDEYLVPGSSPLHIAVIIGNISIVHAILQAHMENMNVVGQGLDERGRRPWEGSSRTDIRSVRNSFRKLPFHLARERGLQQLMSLVDPRIPIDVALDAARDTEHGIGPKRLSTIVSLVLQQSLLHWLDDCQDEIAKEATGHEGMRVHGTTRTPSLTSLDVPTAAVLAAAASLPLGGLPLAPGLPPAPAAGPASITVAKASRSSQNESGTQHQQPSKRPPLPRGTHRQSQSRESTPPGRASSLPPPAPPRAVEPPAYPIPAEHSLEMMPARHSPGGSSGDSPRTPDGAQALGTAAGAVPVPIGQPLGRRVPADMLRGSASTPASPFGLLCGAPVSDPACPYISQSAPVSPATGFAALAGEGTPGGPASQRLPLTASVPGLLQLQSAQEEGSGALHGGDPSGLTRMNSLHAYMGMLSVKRSRTVSLDPPSTHFPHGRVPTLRNGQPVLRTTEGQALATSRRQSLHRQQSLPVNLGVPANVGSANSSFTRADNSLTEEVHDRTVTVVSGKRSIQSTPTIRGMLTSIRERLRSSESIPVPLPASLLEEKDKDLASEPEPPSPTKSDDSEGDVECGICLDHVVEVAFSGCEHSLCLDCARNLTKQDKKPPHCPFCRRMVVGFMRVSPTRHPVQMR